MRPTRFATLVLLSIGVSAYALVAYGLLPLGAVVHPDMRTSFEAHRLTVYTHVFASVAALALGPAQFSLRLRSARPALHRWLGRLYLSVGVLLGGLAGLLLSAQAFGGTAARMGFACLALAWLYSGTRAYLSIRAGRLADHRRWMVRNFSLTFAAVTLRLWLPASMIIGLSMEVAYPVIAWLCWVPNLVAADILFNRTRQPADEIR